MKSLANAMNESLRSKQITERKEWWLSPESMTKAEFIEALKELKADYKYVEDCLSDIGDDDIVIESEGDMIEACRQTLKTIRNKDAKEVFRYYVDSIDSYDFEMFCDDLSACLNGEKPDLI